MSIKRSQAILKRSIDLKFSVWFTLGSENETMFCLKRFFSFLFSPSSFFFPLPSFLLPLSSFLLPPSFFLFPLSSFPFPLSYCRSFSVLKILTGRRSEKSCKCHKTWFCFLSPECKPNAKL